MITIRVWRAPLDAEFGVKYVAVTNDGQLIRGYQKLSDITKRYKLFENVKVVRELDKRYDRADFKFYSGKMMG